MNEAWKNEWMILTPLHTVKVGIKLWMLTKDMKFKTPRGTFTVPKGFLFDHASVPKMFTRIVPPVKSAIAEASVLHDWFYNKNSVIIPRKFADLCLKELTRVRGGSKLLCFNAYTAVRIGGKDLYNKIYAKDKMVDVYPEYKDMNYDELKRIMLKDNNDLPYTRKQADEMFAPKNKLQEAADEMIKNQKPGFINEDKGEGWTPVCFNDYVTELINERNCDNCNHRLNCDNR